MHELLDLAAPADKKLWQQLQLGYTEVKGLPALRQTIVDSFYPDLNPEQILCFAGAEEGIFCALYTLCNPGDHVIILTPCYQSLMEIPKLKGCEITAVELREENLWRIELDKISAAIKTNTKGVIINFPHNPTGQVISEAELTQLSIILAERGIWLFSDEVYRLLGPNSDSWASPAVNAYEHGISLGVMSKAFGLAGLRVGWIACRDLDTLKAIERMKHYTSICNSAPAEILSTIALKNKDRILQRNNQIVEANIKLLDSFMQQYAQQFTWVRPAGGCVGFVKYHGQQHIELLCANLVEDQGVLLLPASIYDVTTNHFRIGFGRKNMPVALARFIEYLNR